MTEPTPPTGPAGNPDTPDQPTCFCRQRADRAETDLALLRRQLRDAVIADEADADSINNMLIAADLPPLLRRWTGRPTRRTRGCGGTATSSSRTPPPATTTRVRSNGSNRTRRAGTW
ncbi:hypothetical protein OHA72_10445 [Dactylosporangium sp. NBC_01737]|uniref:hypothetical protein n=1 Tax=Dactylosporangium sp. NBC_01737 TaxID=2975959 RepID=UPI002E0EBD30|nr:hypothetical protein OHA72_10445 [Dactylosporangium sp. NBC_01737]